MSIRDRVARLERTAAVAPPDPRPSWRGRDPATLTDEELEAAAAHFDPTLRERFRNMTDEELHAYMTERGMS